MFLSALKTEKYTILQTAILSDLEKTLRFQEEVFKQYLALDVDAERIYSQNSQNILFKSFKIQGIFIVSVLVQIHFV